MIGPYSKKANAAWGENIPDWIMMLAQACDRSSQNAVSKQLGRSSALVSQVLDRKYRGDMRVTEQLVRGVFMASTVNCPVLGTLPLDRCQHWKERTRKAISNSNGHQVQMYRACNRCPQNMKETV